MTDILLSTYNGEKFLREQLNSLLLQTFTDFKIIVRDDCSSDSTVDILQEYIKKNPSKFIIVDNEHLNLGSTNSFFELLKHSSGDLIFFCDQDDVWNNNKLEKMICFYNATCTEKDKPILVHSAVDVVDENLCLMPAETAFFNKNKCGMKKDLKWQIFQNDVTGCTVMINAAMRDAVIPIDFVNHNVIQHDWFLALVAFCNNSKYFFSESTIKYRQHSSNVISARQLTVKKRIAYKIKHGISYPFYDIAETALLCGCVKNSVSASILSEFVGLKNKIKVYRIWWHLKNNFFRPANILYKLYQLVVC